MPQNHPKQVAPARQGHIPGEPGVWVLIFGDMMIFTLFFLVFLYYRGQNPGLFVSSQHYMNQPLGVLNTLLMLTSSWFVASGIGAARANENRMAATLFSLAMLCGAGFAVVKYFEYGAKLRHGITISTNIYFTCYYMFTGIHLLHVFVGMALLAFMARGSQRGDFTTRKLALLEVGASFWHFVDLLWIVLFALFYMVK